MMEIMEDNLPNNLLMYHAKRKYMVTWTSPGFFLSFDSLRGLIAQRLLLTVI